MGSRKLNLEALEDRLVPADFGWTGADHNGEWADANNWNCVKFPGTYPNTFQDTAYLGDSIDTIKYEDWNGHTVSGNIGGLDGTLFSGTLKLFRDLTVGSDLGWGASRDTWPSCPTLQLQSNNFTLANNTCTGYWYGGIIGVSGDTGTLGITSGATLNITSDGTTTSGAINVLLNVSMKINSATVNVQSAFVEYVANNPVVTVGTAERRAWLNFSGYRDAGNGTYLPYVFGWEQAGVTGEMDIQPGGVVRFAPEAYYELHLGCLNLGDVLIDGANSTDETIADFTGFYPSATRSYYQEDSGAHTMLGYGTGTGGARLQCDNGFYMNDGWLNVFGTYENNLVCGPSAATNAYFAGGTISLTQAKAGMTGLAVLNVYGAAAYLSGSMSISFNVDPSASYTSSQLYFNEGVTIASGCTVYFTSITGTQPNGRVYTPVYCGPDYSLTGTFTIGNFAGSNYTGSYGPNWFNVTC